MKFYKKLALAAMTAVTAISVTSCDYLTELLDMLLNEGGEDETEYVDQWASLVNETVYDAVVDGNTITYGTHKYTINAEIDTETTEFKTATASVSFTNIPSGLTEFTAVYDNLLGKSLAGTAAMIPMAMEIYARDAATGEACLNLLCNGSATVSEIIRELRNKFVPTEINGKDDPYLERYLPAALLKGATYTNAYKPDTPYTVELTMSPNGVQDAQLTGGKVTYLYILTSGGWDTFQRGVEIFLPYNTVRFKVFNCPSCYTQCRTIQGTWAGLK